MSPELMMMGSAILFAVLCERAGQDPEYIHTMASNLLRAKDEGDHTTSNSLQSLRDFASIRVVGKDTTFW